MLHMGRMVQSSLQQKRSRFDTTSTSSLDFSAKKCFVLGWLGDGKGVRTHDLWNVRLLLNRWQKRIRNAVVSNVVEYDLKNFGRRLIGAEVTDTNVTA